MYFQLLYKSVQDTYTENISSINISFQLYIEPKELKIDVGCKHMYKDDKDFFKNKYILCKNAYEIHLLITFYTKVLKYKRTQAMDGTYINLSKEFLYFISNNDNCGLNRNNILLKNDDRMKEFFYEVIDFQTMEKFIKENYKNDFEIITYNCDYLKQETKFYCI